VVTADGVVDEPLRAAVADVVRSQLSPRHVPDRIVGAPGVPTTLNGKRMEVPVKRLMLGEAPERVANVDAVSDPDVFRWFVEFARSDRAGDR
jgi:acetoacetyl-CoA synthetase